PDLRQVRRDLRQMTQLSGVLEGSKPGLYQKKLAAARLYKLEPELRRELELEWRDGRGVKEAGLSLLDMHLKSAPGPATGKDPTANTLVLKLLRHGDISDD